MNDPITLVPGLLDRLAAFPSATFDSPVFLPTNLLSSEITDSFLYAIETPTCEVVLRQGGVQASSLVEVGKRRYTDNRAADWIAPTIFFSMAALSQNANLISVACGIISNYLSSLFLHNPRATVEMDYMRETQNEVKRFTYKGNIEGLVAAQEIVRRLEREP